MYIRQCDAHRDMAVRVEPARADAHVRLEEQVLAAIAAPDDRRGGEIGRDRLDPARLWRDDELLAGVRQSRARGKRGEREEAERNGPRERVNEA